MDKTIPERKTQRAVRVLFALWLALTALGTAFPGLRLWGLHLPAFLPLWAQVTFFMIAGSLVFLPHTLVERWTARVPVRVPRVRRSVLMALAVVMAFIVFRASYGFLGDGMLRGREAQLGIVRPAEPLPGYLAAGLYHVLHPLLDATGQEAVAAVSIMAGVFFIVVLWVFTRRLWADPRDRATASTLLLGSGISALFFGYIETYSLTAVAMAGFLLAAEVYRRGRGSFAVCLGFFVLAAASHVLTLFLLPALVALSMPRTARRFWRLAAIAAIAVGAIAWEYHALHGTLFGREIPTGSIIIPLVPKPPVHYGLISFAHIADLANLLLLVCPGILIFIPFLWRIPTPKRTKLSRWYWPLAALLPLGIPLFVDPKLGMARDWDLFSLGLVPLVVWAAVRLADNRSRLSGGALALPVFASATTLLMFVAVNATTNMSIARFERVLDLDPSRGGYGREILATWYHEHGRAEDEIRQWRKALQLVEHRRYWTSLSAAYLRAGDIANGFFAARRGYFLDTTYAYSAYYLGATYEEFKMMDSALVYYARAVRLAPRIGNLRYDLALALFRAGRKDAGIAHMDSLVHLMPDSAGYWNALAVMLIDLGRFDEARSSLDQALQRDPADVRTSVNLALLYYKTGNNDLALAEIERLLRRPDLTPEQRKTVADLERRIRADRNRLDETKP